MNKTIGVIGGGSWGTALSIVLAENGFEVDLWMRRQEAIDEILQTRSNQRYLPGVTIPTMVHPTTDLQYVVERHQAMLLVMPSVAFRETMETIKDWVDPTTRLLHATKGFDLPSMNRMSQVILESLPFIDASQVAVLSGPSHAEEVSRKQPTTVVVASSNRETAEFFQDTLMTNYFRVYTHPDVIGTELGGTLKNIIALGVGIADGLGFGDNAKAAIMTRGLHEISRLGSAMGAEKLTFSGLAGVGDLIVTCTSKHSRNWRAGYLLGQGESIENVLKQMNMVVEGIRATEAAAKLAQEYHVEMPITKAIFEVLFGGVSPSHAVEGLMGRMKTHEMEELAELTMKWES